MKLSFLSCVTFVVCVVLFCLPQTAKANPVQSELETYARTTIASLAGKERETEPILYKSRDGKGYIASFTKVIPDAKIRASYSKAPTSMPDIHYIGKIIYTRLRYKGVSGKPANEALSGPFSVSEETGTLLVRYKNGQWMPR